MCVDLMNVEKSIKILERGSSLFHIDIIDWNYCENISLSPDFMQQLKKITNVPLEAHLMVNNLNENLIQSCLDKGADIITMPPELIVNKAFRFINKIQDSGKKAGVYIHPGMPLEYIFPYIHHLDLINIMTVDPGFAGQKFIPETIEKVRQAYQLREKEGYKYKIQVDGSCNETTYQQLREAGADIFVMGSTGLFGKNSDVEVAWEIMRSDLEKTTGEKLDYLKLSA